MPGRSHSEQRETRGDGRLSQLVADNAELRAENARFRAENAQLRQLVEQLQRRLGLDSSNSGKPPVERRAGQAAGQAADA